MKHKEDVNELVEQALEYAYNNPCCLCREKLLPCQIKYKGTCKVYNKLRAAMLRAKVVEE